MRSFFRLVFTAAVLASCHKSRVTPVAGGHVVYAVGWTQTAGNPQIATMWKDGVQSFLSSPVSGAGEGAVATAITLSGTDVYIAGYIYNAKDTSALYWKNGAATVLGLGRGLAIAVSGTTVYVAGVDGTYGHTCYWKNGTLVAMPHPLTGFTAGDCSARAIAVNGGDVYLAGTAWITAGTSLILAPVYWKDSAPTLLDTAGVETSGANAIAVDSPSVYVGGWYQIV